MITANDIRMIDLTLNKANDLFSLGIYDGRIIMVASTRINKSVVYGYNSYTKSHPDAVRVTEDGVKYSSVHAEFNLIKKLNGREQVDTVDSTIYVAGCTNRGNIVTSRPCSHCLNDIVKSKIFDRVVYVIKNNTSVEIVEYKLI